MAKKVFMVLVALVLAVSFSAFAQEKSESETAMNYFSQWDTDGSGTLSQEEFVQGYKADVSDAQKEMLGSGDEVVGLFEKADADGNGEISKDEFEAAVAQL